MNIKGRPNPTWSLQDAKGMLWRGGSEAAVAEAMGIEEAVLRKTMAQEARWRQEHGFCFWCEIRLEPNETEVCDDCARVLRGEQSLLEEANELHKGRRVDAYECGA